jgi:hypothetical protein
MGRAKIPMKYIQSAKSRKITFKQRKHGLEKKISEFCKKSGAKACFIVYDGDHNNIEPTTWPEDLTSVNSLLQEYQNQKIEKTPEIFDVKDYFENKIEKVETKINKVRRDILTKIYPTWHPHFSNLDENQLRDFIATINAKIQACNHKISMLKNMQQIETSTLDICDMIDFSDLGDFPPSSPSNQLSGLVERNGQVVDPDYTSEMVDFTSLGDLPPSSSSNQLSGLVEMSDQVVNPDYMSEIVDFTSLGDLPPSSSANQLSQLVDLDDWINQLDDGVLCWDCQPDEFFWKDLSF